MFLLFYFPQNEFSQVALLFLGTFLFLVCFLISFFICTFVIGNNE